jgi:hypothetical protein
MFICGNKLISYILGRPWNNLEGLEIKILFSFIVNNERLVNNTCN